MGPLHEALAHQPARADGDLRLEDMVAGAERVALGVDQGQHALLLIIMQPLPDMRQYDDDPDHRAEEVDIAHAGQEHDAAADDGE